MTKSWRPSDKPRGLGEPHEYKHNRHVRPHIVAYETRLTWRCPSCGAGNTYIVHLEQSTKLSCNCGAVAQVQIKTPQVTVTYIEKASGYENS